MFAAAHAPARRPPAASDTRTSLALRLFGGLAAFDAAERPLPLPADPATRTLLALLALEQGSHVRRGALACAVWPDAGDAAPAHLDAALAALDYDAPPLAAALVATRWTLLLPDTACEVDVHTFERLLAPLDGVDGGEQPPLSPAALANLAAAGSLYRGDLLPELDHPWLEAPRRRLRRRLRQSLLALTRVVAHQGDRRQAEALAESLAALDPLDQEAQRLLVVARARTGGLDRAIAAQADLLRRLEASGHVTEPETRALGRRLEQAARTALTEQAAHTPAPAGGLGAEPPWPFIGRDRELAAATAAWRRVAQGHGALVAVSGAPGLGRTRLLREVVARLIPRPSVVLAARADPGGEQAPFGPLVRAVHGALATLPVDEWPALDPAAERALAHLLPALGGDPAAPTPEPSAVLAAFERLLRAFGPRTVLVLDDLDHADPATVALLLRLCARLADLPLLLLASATDDAPSTALGALEERADRASARRLELAPLAAADAADLALAAADHTLPPGAAPVLSRLGRGHPVLVVTLARTEGAGVEDVQPAEADAVLAGSVLALPADSGTVLQPLAVLGSARVSLLAATLGWTEERVHAALEPPLRRGLLDADHAGGWLAFAQEATRQVVLREVGGHALAAWQARAGQALATEPGQTGRAADLLLASGHDEAALPLLLDAAGADLALGAPWAAIPRLERAAHLAARLDAPHWRTAALLGLARAQLALGAGAEAERACATLAAEAAARGDEVVRWVAQAEAIRATPPDQRLAPLHALLDPDTLRVLAGRPEAAAALARAAAAAAPAYRRARRLWDDASPLLAAARDLAAGAEDAAALETLTTALLDARVAWRGPWPEALAAYRAQGDALRTAWMLLWLGRHGEAAAAAERARLEARANAATVSALAAQAVLGAAGVLGGDPRIGLPLLRHAADAAREAADGPEAAWPAILYLLALAEIGAWTRVRDLATAAAERIATAGLSDHPLASVVEVAALRAAGMLGDPLAALDGLAALAARAEGPHHTLDRCLALLAEGDLALALGEAERAARAADGARAAAALLGAPRQAAHAARTAALAASRRGERSAALAALAEARSACQGLDEPLARVRLLEVEAEVQPAEAIERALLVAAERVRLSLPEDVREPLAGPW